MPRDRPRTGARTAAAGSVPLSSRCSPTARAASWAIPTGSELHPRQQPEGWFAEEAVTLGIRTGALWADHGGGAAVRLADAVLGLECDYLLVPGADARWVRQWHSPLSAPLAVRLRLLRQDGLQVDTLLLLVRERG